MSVTYSIFENEDMKGATIIVDGEPFTITSTHVSWDAIIDGLIRSTLTADEISGLINPITGISNAFRRISERVSITPNGAITFDGDPQDSALTDHILRIVTAKDGGNRVEEYTALANLLENLSNNPSEDSKDHFYHFVRTHKMTITPDGYLIAYKGVNSDGTSIHAGYGIVDGTEYEHSNLPNAVGSIVEIPRSMVDGNRDASCSVGLHVGSYEYASSFAERLLTVKVNPRDVVAVPSDHSNAKVRVTRYEVIEDNTNDTGYLTTLFQTAEAVPEYIREVAIEPYEETIEDSSIHEQRVEQLQEAISIRTWKLNELLNTEYDVTGKRDYEISKKVDIVSAELDDLQDELHELQFKDRVEEEFMVMIKEVLDEAKAHEELEELLSEPEPLEELTIEEQVEFIESLILKDTLRVKKLIKRVEKFNDPSARVKYFLKIAKANARIVENQEHLNRLVIRDFQQVAEVAVATASGTDTPTGELSVTDKYDVVVNAFGGVYTGVYGILRDTEGDYVVFTPLDTEATLEDAVETPEFRNHLIDNGPYSYADTLWVVGEDTPKVKKATKASDKAALNALVQAPKSEAEPEDLTQALREEMMEARRALTEDVSDEERARRKDVYRRSYDALAEYLTSETERISTAPTTKDILDIDQALFGALPATKPLTGVVAPPVPENGLDPVRIQKTIDEINRLAPTVNLTRYRNKNISSGRRPYFDAALKALGLS